MNPLELEVYHQIKNVIGDRVPIQLIISSLRMYGPNTYLTFANSSLIYPIRKCGKLEAVYHHYNARPRTLYLAPPSQGLRVSV